MKTIAQLTDDELLSCVDGSSDIKLLRELLAIEGVICEDGSVEEETFASCLQVALEDFAEDEDASENNWDWGYEIASNINDLLGFNDDTEPGDTSWMH